MKAIDIVVVGLGIIICISIGAFATGYKVGMRGGRWQCPERIDSHGNKLTTISVLLKNKEILCTYRPHNNVGTYGQKPAETLNIPVKYVGAMQ